MSYTKADIRRICKEENIRYIRMMFTDMMGALKNVEIPVTRLEDALENQVMFDGSSIEGFVRIYEADMYLHPDLDTFLVLSWENTAYGKVARFICDVYQPCEDGTHVPFEGDPRGILKRNIEKMKKLGFKAFNCGVEPEFFLFKLNSEGNPTLEFNDTGSYFDLAPVDSAEDCRRDIVLELQKIGFTIEAAHHEVATGQHEINFKFDSAVEVCDQVQTFKLVVKNIARRHGLHATFMPKPVEGIAGSGMHVNCSLLTMDDKNAFFDPNTKNQLSLVAEKWISGIIHHAKGFCLITNPIVNSYKRLVPGYEAPCYISWSASNRSALIRIPAARGQATRVELRCPDPSCNPYLELAVCLAAGLDGIERGLTPPEEILENIFVMDEAERKAKGIDSLPANLKEAVDLMLEDKVVCDTLGSHIISQYSAGKYAEWDAYRTAVSNWEIDEYLMMY